jgi:hypothetical protein
VKPPKPVQVRRDGVWHPGSLEAWRRDGDDWRAYVRYTIAVGATHLDWVAQDDVRPQSPGGLTDGPVLGLCVTT